MVNSAFCYGGYLDWGGPWVFIYELSDPCSEKVWETLGKYKGVHVCVLTWPHSDISWVFINNLDLLREAVLLHDALRRLSHGFKDLEKQTTSGVRKLSDNTNVDTPFKNKPGGLTIIHRALLIRITKPTKTKIKFYFSAGNFAQERLHFLTAILQVKPTKGFQHIWKNMRCIAALTHTGLKSHWLKDAQRHRRWFQVKLRFKNETTVMWECESRPPPVPPQRSRNLPQQSQPSWTAGLSLFRCPGRWPSRHGPSLWPQLLGCPDSIFHSNNTKKKESSSD